jgi:hypothetical protein
MRHPMERILSGGVHEQADIQQNITLAAKLKTEDALWEFARGTTTDNPVLQILAGQDCCRGANTDRKYLDVAKDVILRISIVLDMACLDRGMEALEDLFHYTLSPRGEKNRAKAVAKHDGRPPPRERIGNDKVYNYLLERNTLELELYEWSKSIALVQCSDNKKHDGSES